jgi:hypothetical protein
LEQTVRQRESYEAITENNTAHRQHLCNIAEAQGEAKVQPNGMTNDLGREAMTMGPNVTHVVILE